MAMNKDIKLKLGGISEYIMDAIDRLEELSEDDEKLSRSINAIIDILSEACDKIDELE